ncbi:YagK/YfjJ domain-containing protein [Aquabacterium sp.]|uniref:YagK/YfjJ domain-containing protein n=1 Tax=Aquabacterium sp. TaxID=1872578 RepID=UPI003CFFA2F2
MTEETVLSHTQCVEVKGDNRYSPRDIDPTYFAMLSKDIPDCHILGEDFDNLGLLIRADQLAMLLSSHEFSLPFEKRYRFKLPKLHINSLGNSLISFLENDMVQFVKAYSHHRFKPTTEAILKEAKDFKPKYPPYDLKYLAGLCSDDACIDDVVAEYNELALKMRQALREAGMGERVKSFRRNATRNYNHLMHVIRACHEWNRKILLIRLDWSEKALDLTLPIEDLSQADFDVAAARVADARDKMVQHLNLQFKGDLLFYAWKIEWGVQKGFHIHWLIGLNGSKYQDRINVPYHIAKHWDEVLFKGGSHTHNINAMSGKERMGLCVLHYADSQASQFFGLYADYLTKVDYNLKLRLPKGMRSFGCTKLNQGAKPKKGPTRSYQMPDYDFATVRGQRGRATGRRFGAKSLKKGLQ